LAVDHREGIGPIYYDGGGCRKQTMVIGWLVGDVMCDAGHVTQLQRSKASSECPLNESLYCGRIRSQQEHGTTTFSVSPRSPSPPQQRILFYLLITN